MTYHKYSVEGFDFYINERFPINHEEINKLLLILLNVITYSYFVNQF